MVEESAVYQKDMETYLKPEEYQAFLKAKEEIQAYRTRRAEYESKKANAEKLAAEYREKEAKAETSLDCDILEFRAKIFRAEATTLPVPLYPGYFFREHDRYIDLVKERKAKHLQEEARRKRQEEERKIREEQSRELAARQKMMADAQWAQFQKIFTNDIQQLKHQLTKSKPPQLVTGCSPEVLKYHPELWAELELPGTDQLTAWAKPLIIERVPEILRLVVDWKLTSQVTAVPRLSYEVAGVPCVHWDFDIYVSAKVDLWIKESTIIREFCGCKHTAVVKTQAIGSFFLGYQLWGTQDGIVTPIALLRLLTEGKPEKPGIEIFTQDPSSTCYTVEGYDECSVELSSQFIRFIKGCAKGVALVQGLLAKGLMDEGMANLIEAKWNDPSPVSSNTTLKEDKDLGLVVAKLTEVGWVKDDAEKAVASTILPPAATIEEKVKIILQGPYGNCT